jgi:hypothetical protein
MSTLTLDLLDLGYQKRKKPAAKPKEAGSTASHPIRWKRPGVIESKGATGPTEMTLRPQTGEPPRDNEQQGEDLSALWNLDEVLRGLVSSAPRQ